MLARCPHIALALLISFVALPGRAADDGDWDFWIQQGTEVHHGPGTVKLKRAPFTIRFKGAAGNAYGFAAMIDGAEMPATTDLGKLFRAGNGLLVDKPNTKISVSDKGVVAKGWSSWNMWAYHPASESQFITGFQRRTANADGSVTLERTIDTMCTDNGSKDICTPAAQVPYSKFYAMITTIPDLTAGQKIDDTRWLGPKLLTIEFE